MSDSQSAEARCTAFVRMLKNEGLSAVSLEVAALLLRDGDLTIKTSVYFVIYSCFVDYGMLLHKDENTLCELPPLLEAIKAERVDALLPASLLIRWLLGDGSAINEMQLFGTRDSLKASLTDQRIANAMLRVIHTIDDGERPWFPQI